MAPSKLLGILLLVFICLQVAHSGKKKKTIKIHVPYYIKHIHHYKKIYVPKVKVIKHEHHHKKQLEHHHHHDHHEHDHDDHHYYDKAGHDGYYDDDGGHEEYYEEDILPKIKTRKPYARGRGRHRLLASGSEHAPAAFNKWKNADVYNEDEEESAEDEDVEEYNLEHPRERIIIPSPTPNNYRFRKTTTNQIPILRKRKRIYRPSYDGIDRADEKGQSAESNEEEAEEEEEEEEEENSEEQEETKEPTKGETEEHNVIPPTAGDHLDQPSSTPARVMRPPAPPSVVPPQPTVPKVIARITTRTVTHD